MSCISFHFTSLHKQPLLFRPLGQTATWRRWCKEVRSPPAASACKAAQTKHQHQPATRQPRLHCVYLLGCEATRCCADAHTCEPHLALRHSGCRMRLGPHAIRCIADVHAYETCLPVHPAGHYVPQLAREVIRYNADASDGGDRINLVGLTLGNAWTDARLDNRGTVDHWCVSRERRVEAPLL